MQPLAPPVSPAARKRAAEPTDTAVDAAHFRAAVARLHEEAQQVADHVVTRARAARLRGATAEACRADALELEHQATRAERLLFSRAVEVFRAAAAESQLVADALDAIEDGQ